MGTLRYARNAGLTRYFSQIRNRALLGREQESSLAWLARAGGRDARDALVEANLGFVVRMAKQYRNLGLPFEDLLNEGNLGLIEAAERFDASRGTRFTTYAIWWIRKSILKALSEHSSLVRIPEYRRRRAREICGAAEQPTQDRRAVPEMDRLHSHGIALDARGEHEGATSLAETLACERSPNAEQELIRVEIRSRIDEAVRRLSDRQSQVIRHRFGLAGETALTLKEIGETMGLSRERVRQIENEALRRLRRHLAVGLTPTASTGYGTPARCIAHPLRCGAELKGSAAGGQAAGGTGGRRPDRDFRDPRHFSSVDGK